MRRLLLAKTSLRAWIIHEHGEIWVEQGFSPAFTARLNWRLKARMVAGFSAGLKACSTRFVNDAC
jgi:hypothetical protein